MDEAEILRVAASDRIAVCCELLERYPSKVRLLDVAAGHCKFSVAAARLGRQVTAIDARTGRVPFDVLTQHKIKFVHADINRCTLDLADFDAILLLGILYHLTLEEQIALLPRCSSRLTIIDTHYTLQPDQRRGSHEGWIYLEPSRKGVRSAFTSPDSFWHSPASLLRLLRNSGFGRVMKVEPETNPTERRSFYVCEP